MSESSPHKRILAFSDLHGDGFQAASALIDTHRPDWVITCGDMLPDFHQRPSNYRLKAQHEFWMDHRSLITREGIVTTMIVGNHELPGFRYPRMDVLPAGFEGSVLRLEGVPRDFGPFSFVHGLPDTELEEEIQAGLSHVPDPIIYVSHAPPYGSCDRNFQGDHIGHRPFFQHLNDRDWPQALVLCGHVHHSFGMEVVGETTILNVATGFARIEFNKSHCMVHEMGCLVESGNSWNSP